MQKAGIESAVRRGQGISASGAALENVVVECLGPGGAAFVMYVDAHKLRHPATKYSLGEKIKHN